MISVYFSGYTGSSNSFISEYLGFLFRISIYSKCIPNLKNNVYNSIFLYNEKFNLINF